MGYKYPIDIKTLRKIGVIKPDDFYREIANEHNYTDPQAAKEFYMAVVRATTKLLRKNGVVEMPHIGIFALVKQKDRLRFCGKTSMILKDKHILSFFINKALKLYFTKLENSVKILDPRDKFLKK